MQSFYSSNLTYSHAYLKINIKPDEDIEEALTIFNNEIQQLLSKNQGKVMHTKTFQQKANNGQKRVQIRCYFAYNKAPFKGKDEWCSFVEKCMSQYIDGQPSFIEMVPLSFMKSSTQ